MPDSLNIEIRLARLVTVGVAALLALLVTACGGGGGGEADTPAPAPVRVTVTSTMVTSSAASLRGTSWVSKSYFGSTCAGLACLLDTSRTNDYPGVDVTWMNLTTGVSGRATSYYGPGTGWIHEWRASIPVTTGSNTIQISAYDPGGTGGSIIVDVIAPPPSLDVLSTSPANGTTAIAASSTISATFGVSVDPLSVNAASFYVTGPSGNLAGNLSVNANTVTFTPTDYLDNGAVYTVTLTTALTSTSGQPLPADYSWMFSAGYTAGNYYGIWGSGANDVFIVGFGPILHYDGKALVDMTTWDVSGTFNTSPYFHVLYSAWGSSPTDVFAAGDYGTILHYDGNAWTAMDSGSTATIADIWGSSASNVFAVGYDTPASGNPTGVILHYDGNTWTAMPPAPTGGLYSVWGSSASDVFAAGIDTLLHYDGNTWTAMDPGTSNVAFSALWGSAADDVFATGSWSTLMHYDGSNWTSMQPAPVYYMYGIWGTAPDSAYAVGSQGTILHYDGSNWSTMPVPSTAHELYDVWASADNDVFAVGAFSSVILHYDGSIWSILP